MNDVPMDLDGLTPVAGPGPRGVQDIIQRLEQEALAEAARDAALQNGEASRPPNSTSSTSPMPAYVPGAKKRRLSQVAGESSDVPSTSESISNGATATGPASSSMRASTSGEGRVGKEQGGAGNHTKTGSTSAASASAAPEAPPPEPKRRKQPTIRMTFNFLPYPPNKLPEAKHVPIFQVHDAAEKAGLLLPEEQDVNMDDASSSDGASDDEEGGDKADNSNDGDETVEMSESQKAIKDAMEMARRKGGPVMKKKRVRDRDEGYDVEDDFVDDSELAINEPKYVPETKVKGYCAIKGEVEIISAEDAPKKGRKAGSVNKPKVVVAMADGTTKMVSEAVAAKEKKKAAKAAEASGSAKPGKDASASASPTPASIKPESSKGPLQSRDVSQYSHLPSSTTNGAPPGSPPPRSSTSKPPSTTPAGEGSRASPIALDDDDEGEDAKPPRKTESTPAPALAPPATSAVFSFDPSPSKNGKKVYDPSAFSPELQKALNRLQVLVSRESFVPKNKFPPALKGPLVDAVIQAMKSGEYDDPFIDIMPSIFPYNRFTMNKMIKREVCDVRCAELEKEIAECSEKLKTEVDKAMPTMQANYDEAIKKWEAEYAEWKIANITAGGGNEALQPNQSRQSLTPVGSDGDTSAANAKAGAKDEGPPKPLRKFRFNDTMRMYLYRIMTNSHEVHERKHDKAEVEGKELPSQMNATKARYSQLVKTAWPEDWMATNQLSRELTAAKRKIEKEMNTA